jgi:N-methylhydantoinase A
LEARALREAEQEGLNPKKVKLTRQFDLRYPFQGYDLTVDFAGNGVKDADKAKISAAFHRVHEETYGTAAHGEIPDIVNVRVTSMFEVNKLELPALKAAKGTVKPVGKRRALFNKAKGYVSTPIYDRASLPAGWSAKGPVIIEQLDSTTVVLPGQSVKTDKYGNLVIKVGG